MYSTHPKNECLLLSPAMDMWQQENARVSHLLLHICMTIRFIQKKLLSKETGTTPHMLSVLFVQAGVLVDHHIDFQEEQSSLYPFSNKAALCIVIIWC